MEHEVNPMMEMLRQQIATSMLDMAGVLQPIYDAADGMRRELESRGWSPTQAEASAGAWLTSTLGSIGGGVR
ncbi:hypothetical protein GCM10009548_02030 [Streptomyces malaysiensis subsp. malaysiensis]|uniref:WXG100 family type VII secretion target n=1 Tax=Streptomyces malaysiensis TaxID=92644 RepID=A0ABX6W4C6_STRMQ|nr:MULTISPECIES: hypothetical protein [Streptomyces]QPI56332.1 hypothetical protein I1A49_16535 [Streptomyces solisilvae]UHH17819.1 hypothetical protein LUV23_16650 [Streptomyces sp. HNM0561]